MRKTLLNLDVKKRNYAHFWTVLMSYTAVHWDESIACKKAVNMVLDQISMALSDGMSLTLHLLFLSIGHV